MFLDYSSFNNAWFSELQEEMPLVEGPTDEVQATVDEALSVMDDFQERRAQAIAAKAREIEKVWETPQLLLNFYFHRSESI